MNELLKLLLVSWAMVEDERREYRGYLEWIAECMYDATVCIKRNINIRVTDGKIICVASAFGVVGVNGR